MGMTANAGATTMESGKAESAQNLSLSFIAICERLLAAQLAAETPDAREAADADFSHFLRMSSLGRLQEWIDGHQEQAS